jgi:hypothetical protein
MAFTSKLIPDHWESFAEASDQSIAPPRENVEVRCNDGEVVHISFQDLRAFSKTAPESLWHQLCDLPGDFFIVPFENSSLKDLLHVLKHGHPPRGFSKAENAQHRQDALEKAAVYFDCLEIVEQAFQRVQRVQKKQEKKPSTIEPLQFDVDAHDAFLHGGASMEAYLRPAFRSKWCWYGLKCQRPGCRYAHSWSELRKYG